MLTVGVQAYSAVGRIAPADLQALSGALVPVAGRLDLEPPPLAGSSISEGLAYEVVSHPADDNAAFREQCRQVGLVFALSRVRPDWAWSVRATPALLSEAAGGPDVLWIKDGAVVLRHADAPRGERVVSSEALSQAVIAELVHGLGADALRWLGIAVDGSPQSRRAALEARAEATGSDAPRHTLDGPVAGGATLDPLDVQNLAVSIEPPTGGGLREWTCVARIGVSQGASLDGLRAVVRLRSGDGRLLDVAESSIESVAPGETVTLTAVSEGRGALGEAVAADAWFAMRRTHRVSGTVAVTTEEG